MTTYCLRGNNIWLMKGVEGCWIFDIVGMSQDCKKKYSCWLRREFRGGWQEPFSSLSEFISREDI